ncbi:hypothetical protein ANANG_G00281900 [Anguilla anguilla]|uniref:Glucagon / GIP / secretin / VIP family domain-containing protein n=1 Tax=Anguilla anguilla TaxID=7936 RepID=A0A9D3RKR5_ANGAN|nr:hypothetical protein ANANG_G00281900 [Anguilla anguilla]
MSFDIVFHWEITLRYISFRTPARDHEATPGRQGRAAKSIHQQNTCSFYSSTPLLLYFSTSPPHIGSDAGRTMKGIHSLAGLLLLIIVQSSWEIPIQETEDNSSLMTEDSLFDEPKELTNVKRHSQGTFTNDYSKYLETRRAQDFVQWLMNSKRSGGPTRRHAEGTYTSDVSSYLQDQAAKEFVSWLKTGRGRRE